MEQTAISIVKTLKKAGHTAYFAGGYVRDILLDHEPDDIDIATNARPEEIEKLFRKTYSIGKHFGVILVEENGHHFEIATFRSDSGYSDGRRPNAVLFTTAEEDALRRDFTINGMFFDPISRKIHDYVGGEKDLQMKTLRFIRDPDERINEDHLRILRAVRFKNRFGFTYDKKSEAALKKNAGLISRVSVERIQDELTKMLVRPTRKNSFEDLFHFQILHVILPELLELKNIPQPENFHAEGDAFIHTMLVIQELPEKPSPELAWAGLFHDLGKAETLTFEGSRIRFPYHAEAGEKIAKKILKRLKFSKTSEWHILWLIKYHHLFDEWEQMKWHTKIRYFDNPFFDDLIHLHRADLFGCIPLIPDYHKLGEEKLKTITEEYERAHFMNLLPSAMPEHLSGNEIMEILSLSPGWQVGEVKKNLRDAQLMGEVKTKKGAIAWVKRKYRKNEEVGK